jgi:ABC-type bacteriocin/lantibiotic exporter with double-glycine peptidase domain
MKDSLKRFNRLLFLIKPYWAKLIKGIFLNVVLSIIGLIAPYLTKLLVDKVYPTQDVNLMHVLVGEILAISISSVLLGAIQGFFNYYVNSKLNGSVSLMFFNHIQHLNMRFFEEHRTGEIMTRFSDISSSLNSLSKVFQTIFVNGIYLLLVPTILLLLYWKMAVVALISVPVVVLCISMTGKHLRKYWQKSSEAYAELNAYQVEMLTHVRSIKTLVLEKHVINEATRQTKNALQLQLKAEGMGQLLGLSNGILYSLNTALITWLGWTYILNNSMTLGDFIAFSSYIGYLYTPVREFINLFSEFQRSSVNLYRMFEYLDKIPEQNPNNIYHPKEKSIKLAGKIDIKDLSFGYSKDIRILHNINLSIEPGTITLIVGPSGSGKTSLLKLFICMEKPSEGEIFYDGAPLSQMNILDIRKQITIVLQEFSMFRGSIRDNLTLGLEDVDYKAIEEALRIVKMDEYINSLQNGINTSIAEWGASLSGGQRQRLAIARAILRNTPIIIFDESTSNIDINTEQSILVDMFGKLRGKTIIFVTHRISSASLADKVCILENGKVIDYGLHSELLQRCKSYMKIVNMRNEMKRNSLMTMNI